MRAGLARGAAGAVSGLASVFPSAWSRSSATGDGDVGALRARARPLPVPGRGQVRARPARRPGARGRARAAAQAEREARSASWTRGSNRRSRRGRDRRVGRVPPRLARRARRRARRQGRVAGGSTAKAMGGVRQQFSTAAEVRLAQESIRFFEELGPPLFDQVGYLFLATTEEGLAALEERRALQEELGVPVERVDPAFVHGLRTDDVLGAVVCSTDGIADPPAVTRELVRRATKLGVEVREGSDAATLEADALVIACGPWSAELGATRGVELPVRPLCRQLLATGELELPDDLPMVVEAETGFHFRRRGDRLVLAMTDPEPRWGFDEVVDESLFDDRLERLRAPLPAGGRGDDRGRVGRPLRHDPRRAPDPRPGRRRRLRGLRLQRPRLHAVARRSARALAEEILGESPSLDLGPYRLERFEDRRRVPRDASPLARTPRRPRGPCRSAHARARPARRPPRTRSARSARRPGRRSSGRPPARRAACAQLVERRHRVREVPEQQPDGHYSSGTPGVGSFSISSLIARSSRPRRARSRPGRSAARRCSSRSSSSVKLSVWFKTVLSARSFLAERRRRSSSSRRGRRPAPGSSRGRSAGTCPRRPGSLALRSCRRPSRG